MNRGKFCVILGLVSTAIFFGACSKSKDDTPTPPVDEGATKYVLMTVSDRDQPYGGGYISTFDNFPSGTVSNVVGGKSLVALRGATGWRTYGNWLFKMFRSADAVQGIEKIEVSADGTVTSGKFITSKNPTEAAKHYGTGNFVINNETSGFYWDAAEPLKIQQFNPSTMSNTGSIDLTTAVNARGSNETGINFRAIGQKFLAIKNGKLFANITYGKLTTNQAGFFDDFYTSVYIAVIDIATGQYEKTIEVVDAGGIAYINENPMYDFDTNGDLYIVTQGRSAIGGKSKIVRILANQTDIDKTWELKFSDFRATDDGKFVNVFAKDGRLIVTLNTIALTGGPTGNINSADIWEFYSVNVANPKTFNKISGVPVATNPGAALAVVEMDGKVLLRAATQNSTDNGYYEYNASANSATRLFNINQGGAVSGFAKITIK